MGFLKSLLHSCSDKANPFKQQAWKRVCKSREVSANNILSPLMRTSPSTWVTSAMCASHMCILLGERDTDMYCVLCAQCTHERSTETGHSSPGLQPSPPQPLEDHVPLPGSHSRKHSIGDAGSLDNVTKPWHVWKRSEEAAMIPQR